MSTLYENLKAWSHWVKNEVNPSQDRLEMAMAIDQCVEVVEAARDLIGVNNIGKTIDTSIDWSRSDVSACFKGSALTRINNAIKKLEKE
jgi:hypothetical protein